MTALLYKKLLYFLPMKKFIPLDILWNGKFYEKGVMAEVPDDLATAIDLMTPAPVEEDKEPEVEEEKPKRRTPARTEV